MAHPCLCWARASDTITHSVSMQVQESKRKTEAATPGPSQRDEPMTQESGDAQAKWTLEDEDEDDAATTLPGKGVPR